MRLQTSTILAPGRLCRACFLPAVASLLAASSAGQSPTADGFNPGPGGVSVVVVALQPDGKVLAGGFDRLNPDGGPDVQFSGPVPARPLAIQTDGSILVSFPEVVWRLNSDGTLGSIYTNSLFGGGTTAALAIQADDRILVGGSFTTFNGQPQSGLARLNADGIPDGSFSPPANGGVTGLALQGDGKILAAGSFTNTDGQSRQYLARLNSDGSLDTNFTANLGGGVTCLAVQADGKIDVATSASVTRLNADGTVDPTFQAPFATSLTYSLALQADGRILVGGNLIASPVVSTNLCRLNTDGTVDTTFEPEANGPVYSLALQPDGKTLVGGWFTALGGQTRTNLGRLNASAPAPQSLTFDGTTITWLRGGTSQEVWRASFEASTNGVDWFPAGAGIRISGGWQVSGLSLPTNTFIRAHGFVIGSGFFANSAWFVEQVASPPPLVILRDSRFGFSSNGFGFRLTAPAGQVVVVEGSQDLTGWVPLATNLAGSTPSFYSDPQSGAYLRRFYRLQSQSNP